MSRVTDDIRATATEIHQGNDICQKKLKSLLTKIGFPHGLLSMEDIEEFGYVEGTGFVWIKQKNKSEHKFEKIGKVVQYAPEVTAYFEKNKIKKLTGAKVKELFMWITVAEAFVHGPSTGKITFKSPAGLPKTFPISAFEIDEPKDEKQEVKDTNGVKATK